ncbi:MAG: hypothetical protein J5778_04670 [Clostridiales bacterium]|nr:hypothetical protein [Clostridiales bacterium]
MQTIRYKDNFRKLLTLMITVMIVFAGLFPAVRADTGAKPETEITVVNAPGEDYYIALLATDGIRSSDHSPDTTAGDKENEIIKTIEEYEDPDGYYLFKNFNKFYMHSNKDNRYLFFGQGGVLPKTYKIMIVTLAGEIKVSPAISQKAFWAKMSYDYSSNTITEDYNGVYTRCIPWVFVFFFITLFNEGLILLAFNLFRKKNLLPFFIINVITQLILNAINIVWYLSGANGKYFLAWIAAEVVITVIEALWYSKKLIRKDGSVSVKRNVLYAIAANHVSALADLPLFLIMFIYPVTRGGLW